MQGRILVLVLIVAAALAAGWPGGLSAEPPDGPTGEGVLPAPWSAGDTMPASSGAWPDQDPEEPDPGYIENRLLVHFERGTSEERKRELHAQLGAQVVDEIPVLGVQVLRLYADAQTMVSAYQANDDVTYAEPDYKVHIFEPVSQASVSAATGPLFSSDRPAAPAATQPNDPLYSQQWHHSRIDSSRAWDYADGTGITVAIIDTGVNCNHGDLSGKCVPGYDFINRDNDPDDDFGHGTHVAGIAAASTNNSVGVAATGWNATIMPVKSLDATGNGGHSVLASGITWSVDNGADVINMSLGGFFTSSTLRRAIEYAVDSGVTVVAAAGNENTSNPVYPGAYPGVIAVAATTQSDTRASFSNYGNQIDIAAPGVAILSTVRQGGYQAWNGTSMASPVVAGVAALLLDQDPDRSPSRVEEILETTAVDLGAPGWDQLYGAGRIDAGAALAADPDGGAPQLPPTATRPPPTLGPPTVTPTPSGDFVQQVEDLINLERGLRGKPPLHTHSSLRQAAGRHSADMAANVICQHGGSDGSTPGTRMLESGYTSPYGEIVACGQTSPASVVYTWMQSEPHQALIMCDACTELGAGYSASTSGFLHYWTVNFGSRDTGGAPTPTLASPEPGATSTPGPPTSTPLPLPPTPTSLPGSVDVVLTPPSNRTGWVVSTEPHINHFNSANTYTGMWDGKLYHGAMQFDLDPIPPGAHVNFARLSVTGRSSEFIGASGTWTFNLLSTDADANFDGHGYSIIHSAAIDATLQPWLAVIDLGAGRRNEFNLTEGQISTLSSRVNGSRLLSVRIDGPESGSGSNLFTWDTGYTAESLYPGPELFVNYSLTPPTAAPTETATEIPPPSETPLPPTDGPTATATLTPEPPTETATAPPPPPTATPTSTEPPPPDAPVEFVPGPSYVGWVREFEPGNHFGDDSILSGYYDGLGYIGAVQFDISSIPGGSEITAAQLVFTGQQDRYLAGAGNGLWRVKLLQATADPGWPNHSYPTIASARVFSILQPPLRQYDLGIGRRNVYTLDGLLLRELEWRAETTGRVSFRIDGPRGGLSNVFDWESGYGVGSQSPPVLAIAYGPPNGNEPLPTPVPEHEERIDAIVDLINEVRADEGLAPVSVNPDLKRAAEVHNFDMTFHDFFSHIGTDGSGPADRVARTGYNAEAVDEMIAARSSDPIAVLSAWMGRAQRDVILNPSFTEIGADYTQYLGAAYNHYWTVVLARPAASP